MEGVVRTRVGYAGGKHEDPTYTRLGDHTETIQIDFDPREVSYEDLLSVFWEGHNPTRQSSLRQYRNIIFYHDADQKRIALESKERIRRKLGREVGTDVLPFERFYAAEDYHQKYALQRHPDLMEEFFSIYPSIDQIVSSTSAARVNGYLAGYGSGDTLKGEIHGLGLSKVGSEQLLKIVCGSSAALRCATPEEAGATKAPE